MRTFQMQINKIRLPIINKHIESLYTIVSASIRFPVQGISKYIKAYNINPSDCWIMNVEVTLRCRGFNLTLQKTPNIFNNRIV